MAQWLMYLVSEAGVVGSVPHQGNNLCDEYVCFVYGGLYVFIYKKRVKLSIRVSSTHCVIMSKPHFYDLLLLGRVRKMLYEYVKHLLRCL